MTWDNKDLLDFKIPIYFYECRTFDCSIVLFDPKRNCSLPGYCPNCKARGVRIVG